MVTLILARGGSKRVPNKNILKIGKYPLIAFPIMAAIKLGHDVYVSTDSIKIRNVAKKYGAKVIDRPPHLSTSSSLDIDAFRHFVSETGIIEDILHLRATTPLVNNDELEKIISFFQKNKDVCTSLRTAHESSETAYKFFKKNGIYWNGLFNKSGEYYNKPGQELPKTFVPNGYADIVRPLYFMKNENLHGNKILSYITEFAPEVDIIRDFEYLKFYYKKYYV